MRASVCAWALALALCAAGTTAGAMTQLISQGSTEAEKRTATRAYLVCLQEQARRMDDGVSDALTVGAVVAPLCRSQLLTSLEVYTRGWTARDRLPLYESQIAREATIGAQAVLTERRARGASAPP